MKPFKVGLGLALLGACLAVSSLRAEEAKSYQVTGPVLEVKDSYIIVQKGEEKWQIACNKNTKGGDVKVGDKVTVYYQMVAKEVEVKPAPAANPKAEKAGKSEKKK